MLPLTVLGKLNYKIVELTEDYYDKLEIFCELCSAMGYVNNSNFKNMKLEKMKMPYGKYYIAIDTDRDNIFSVAGVHQLHEIGPDSYRCLFRGAQLPGYTPSVSGNFFKHGIHFGYFLYAQIVETLNINPRAEFYISTNVDNQHAGKSSRINKRFMPMLEKIGYWELYKENFELYNTVQNIYKVNYEFYLQERRKFIPGNLLK
jgi:hypothetical protein